MIGVIADDLTGAAELGAVGLRHGLRAEVVVKGSPSGTADLVCLDTDSRSCGAKEAGQRAAIAARTLRASGADWIYKKVDSVLRGRVVPEIEAVMPQLGRKRALLLSANPSLGRTVFNGEYFIHGRPIHETEFARDPDYPRLSPRVLDLLQASKHAAIRVCKPIGRAHGCLAAEGITVCEARNSADLRRWAAAWTPDLLPAGGAEFFAALLARAGYKPMTSRATVAHAPTTGPHLFVSGTLSESGRDFIREARRRGAPAFRLPRELAGGARMTAPAVKRLSREVIAALGLHPAVILYIGLPQVRSPGASKALAKQLVRVVASVLSAGRIGEIFVEGGATAVELVRRMGWGRFSVMREVALGVATLQVVATSRLCVTMKPGSYTWPAQIRGLINEQQR